MARIDTIIEVIWRDCVAADYVYRGMSMIDLTDPIDPAANPHAEALPLVSECLEFLQRVVASGFEFTLVETHWGQSWRHDLKNIVAWTRNDLEHPRIDFTSNRQAAREYSDNWQGSQLKQNMKYVAENLPGHMDDPLLKQVAGGGDWALLERVRDWVNTGHGKDTGIVLSLRRSHPALRSKLACAPIGTLQDFRGRILQELDRKGLPGEESSVLSLLPREFDAYVLDPLGLEDIEGIEETTG